jgi:hypothetical protein
MFITSAPNVVIPPSWNANVCTDKRDKDPPEGLSNTATPTKWREVPPGIGRLNI